MAAASALFLQRFPEVPITRDSFAFAASGDFGDWDNADMLALAKRAKAANASFLLALGDLGYKLPEAQWCAAIKSEIDDVTIIAGNHDTNETGFANMSRFVEACPFTLGVGLTAGPDTPGYGYEYSFDYPAAVPLARFILISPGIRGSLGYNYSAGSAHTTWVETTVADARARGIPWVIAGMHKQCIGVSETPYCEMGKAIFNKLVELRVDLILQTHDHAYERSKQIALRAGCSSVRSDGAFNPACVAAEPVNDTYDKGVGAVVVVQGVGGKSFDNVTLDGTDPELGYFVAAMGGNASTQEASPGFGYVRYAVSRDRVSAETDFCPAGSAGADGQCPLEIGATFHDSFSIESPAQAASSSSGGPTWAPATAASRVSRPRSGV